MAGLFPSTNPDIYNAFYNVFSINKYGCLYEYSYSNRTHRSPKTHDLCALAIVRRRAVVGCGRRREMYSRPRGRRCCSDRLHVLHSKIRVGGK